MPRLRNRLTAFSAIGALLALPLVAPTAMATTTTSTPTTRQAEFAAAATEFHVPETVLLAVSYNESQWDFHGGSPSFAGSYGLMNLTDVTPAIVANQGIPAGSSRSTGELAAPALHTANAAASLVGLSVTDVQTNETDNIRAGAALLASYEKTYDHGRLPANVNDWYVGVARYSEGSETPIAKVFADEVYGTLRTGASLTTGDGQLVTEPAVPSARPQHGQLTRLGLTDEGTLPPVSTAMKPECPADLHCTYRPSAYAQTGTNKVDYGDHDIADRPNDIPIRYISLHDTEETFDGTQWLFQDPTYQASAHYVVGTTGAVTQMIPTKDIAWDTANESVYQHSVGIEQEGYAVEGATWYTPQQYEATARLVRYLAKRFDIPLDRAHILGHDSVPAGSSGAIAGQHWDPGPYWNWQLFMDLLKAPVHQNAPASSDVVTVAPQWRTDKQVLLGCLPLQSNTPYPGPYHAWESPSSYTGCSDATGSTTLPKQSTSFVSLHTSPSDQAPLISDPYLHTNGSAGTTEVADWGDKAPYGDQYVVADRQGDWLAIWFAGQKAWFYDPTGAGRTAVPSKAQYVVTPRAGLASIPVYVASFPEASAYPAGVIQFFGGVPRTQRVATSYTITAGQSYVAGGPAIASNWYNAYNIDGSAPYDRTEFIGKTMFYEIIYNHRIAFVNSADVTASASSH
jgi:N-acetyl-anhydromuramyl-L-alanine amidase AmpD